MDELMRVYGKIVDAYMDSEPNSADERWYLESFAFLFNFIYEETDEKQ